MDQADRRLLRLTLRERFDWLDDPTWGPQTVTAGECDGCGEEARLIQPCGPPPAMLGRGATPDWALGRNCLGELGVSGWCDGHADEAVEALAWLEDLPANADVVARLWWLASGEVRPDPALKRAAEALVAGR